MTLQAKKFRAKTAWIQCLIFLGIWFASLVLFSLPYLIYYGVVDATPPDFNSLKADSLYLMASQLSAVLAVLFAVYIMRRVLEKEAKAFPWLKLNVKDFLKGSLLAFLLISTSTAILYLSGLAAFSFQALSMDLVTYLGLFMLVAIHEEVLCRGYLLDTLHKAYGKYAAVLVSTLIFAGLHIFNSHLSWIGMANIFLAGVLMAFFFLRGRNLWAPIGIHFAWNYAQGPVFGFGVSGLSVNSLLEADLLGNDMLSGGQFGLEGSLITLGILAFTILFFVLNHYRQQPMLRENQTVPEPLKINQPEERQALQEIQ